MKDFLESDIFQIISGIDTFGSIITTMAALVTLVLVLRRERKWRKEAAALQEYSDFNETIDIGMGITTSKPLALCISTITTNNSLKLVVNEFLNASGMKMPLLELNKNGIKGREGVIEFNDELREIRNKIDLKGYTEVHLFMASPVALGPLVGALLDNWKLVKVYHKNQEGNYEYWYPIIKN